MKQQILTLAAVAALSACSSGLNEVEDGGDTDTDTGTDTSTGAASDPITLFEAVDGAGGGYVTSITYDPIEDVLVVEGLPFDGDSDNPYDAISPAMAVYQMFESVDTVTDPDTGATIDQYRHLGIRGEGASTEFAIARTGDYLDYGFGGFMYLRDGSVIIPVIGQATYSGDYSGLRIYQNAGGLDVVTGDVQIDIDFEHFEVGDAIKGSITNRMVYDGETYVDITDSVEPTDGGGIPDLDFVVAAGSVNDDGSMSTTVFNILPNATGDPEQFESGTFYGLLSGDAADELVGIIVLEGLDARNLDLAGGDNWTDSELTYQETGGFIATRD